MCHTSSPKHQSAHRCVIRPAGAGSERPVRPLCAWCCRNPSIDATLVGMAAPEVVASNVQAVLEALGQVPCEAAALEAQVTEEVAALLAPVLNTTWTSGLPENN